MAAAASATSAIGAAPRIQERALIGDCRSAALVDGRGGIDWLCWPRFDSDPVFASLLDPERGGVFRIAPAGASRSAVRYVEGTNVAVTRFDLGGASIELVDAMSVDQDGPHDRTLLPEHEIVRIATCTAGEVLLRIELDPRPGFGSRVPRLRPDRHGTVRFEDKGALYTLLLSGAPPAWRARPSSGLEMLVTLRAGQRICASLSFAHDAPAVLSPVEPGAALAIDAAVALWRGWAARASYDGPYREAVVRSALALKLLCYAPSGAIIAAPTTSLPEARGGSDNWDYRFCWLRDAALTTRALYGLGYAAEGDGFVDWLLHATRLTRPALGVLYDVFGEQPKQERMIEHFSGFDGARPVRAGNGAMGQVQLDVYGEVIDAVSQAALRRRDLDSGTASMLEELGEYVFEHWREPDQGIWEPRHEPQRHVHSCVLCWVALDRLLTLEARGLLPLKTATRARFTEARDEIAGEVRAHGWSDDAGSYVATLGGTGIDSSLLLLGWYGFEDPASLRMRSTAGAIDQALHAGGGLIRRNRELADDGGFVATSFWMVEHLARGGGTLEEARRRFEALLALASPTGLYSEIVDGRTGEHLGNYPQGFSHLALINAALAIAEREEREGSSL